MASGVMIAVKPEKIAELDSVIKECSLSNASNEAAFQQTFKLAAGVQRLRELISDDAMKPIMALQNTSLGFRTDKQDGYPLPIVKDAIIEGTLRGLRPIANEINIISGRMYATKEGLARLVREFAGLSDLRLSPGVPRMMNGGAVVPYKATWKVEGKPDAIDREIPVKVNAGMGSDAIIGKATRKMLAAIYGQLTGSEHSLPEGEVGDVETPVVRSSVNDNLPPEQPPELAKAFANCDTEAKCDETYADQVADDPAAQMELAAARDWKKRTLKK